MLDVVISVWSFCDPNSQNLTLIEANWSINSLLTPFLDAPGFWEYKKDWTMLDYRKTTKYLMPSLWFLAIGCTDWPTFPLPFFLCTVSSMVFNLQVMKSSEDVMVLASDQKSYSGAIEEGFRKLSTCPLPDIIEIKVGRHGRNAV